MSNRASADRYAKALFDVALKEASPEQVDRDLGEFAALLAGHADLQMALTNPAVPVGGKRAIVAELVARARPVSPVAKLLGLLGERDRVELLPDIVEAYRERLMDYQQVVRAEVVTARPLDDTRATALQQQLAAATGRTVAMSRRVDPAILGGVVARVGGTVYDGSIASHLARMREKLIADA